MGSSFYLLAFLALLLGSNESLFSVNAARLYPASSAQDSIIRMPTDDQIDDTEIGTRWAVLVAGSAGYGNYRHQADVCHAYQLLLRGGLKEENIVVFMYDDIADNEFNPQPGVIINSPEGSDVYAGVPKDYTGSNVTVSNLFAVLLGNTSALDGGSGKVVDSGPEDHIFIYYSDHGGPGVLGMPTYPNLFADDLIEVLQKKYDAGGYREMVIYVEACESGSIFEGLLPDNLNIYVTTAANAEESSWGTYCPGSDPSPPAEYFTCLGDLYSVAWMEDSERNNLEEETLYDQYSTVKTRTSINDTYMGGSHVMQYGDSKMTVEDIYVYMGNDPANHNTTYDKIVLMASSGNSKGKKAVGVNQRDADLLFLWHKFKAGMEGSHGKIEAQQELIEALSYRMHLDDSVARIGQTLFGYQQGPIVLHAVRSPGMPLVDDWLCLKSMVRAFESHCGSLTDYGLKHMRAFANICNSGIKLSQFTSASVKACSGSKMSGTFNPHVIGFSA